MNYTNLYEYTINGYLLKNLIELNLFDLIILDDNILFEKQNENIIRIKDLNYSEKLIKNQIKNKKSLIILNKLNISFVKKLIDKKNNISVINLGVGISSYINKNNLESNDIQIARDLSMSVYEPYDIISMFQILKKNSNNYIRVANKYIPNNLFVNDIKLQNIIDLSKHGIEGKNGTIVCFGYMLNEIIEINNELFEDGISFDKFCTIKYDFQITKAIEKSLSKTKKLIIIYDQENYKNIKKLILEKLNNKGIKGINIKFVKPEFENIKTNSQEYIFEQGNFDKKGIKEKLKAIV